MWVEVASVLRRAPEIALFLALAIGYTAGRIPIAGVTLGTTVSTLLAATVISQVGGLTVDPLVKSVLFALFIFTVGYRSGPQFFASFKRDAGPELAIAIVLAFTGIATTIVVAKTFGLDKGAAGGLLAGALTQSPALGATTDAVGRLGLPPSAVKALTDSAAVAFAVSYLFGEFGLLVFVRNVAPRLLGVDLKAEAAKLESQRAGGTPLAKGQLMAYYPIAARAYRASPSGVVGMTLSDLESRLGPGALVARLERNGTDIPTRSDLAVEAGDVLGITGRRASFLGEAAALIGREVDDPSALGIVLQTVDAVVTNPAVNGRSLHEIAEAFGGRARGLSVVSIRRVEQTIPVTPGTRLRNGDVVRLVGDESHVHDAARVLGYADWPSDKSDLAFLGGGIALGTIVGLWSMTIAGVRLSLGAGGGVLLAGLVLGWLRAKHPTFGKLPATVQWAFSDLGLNGFVASIGLSVGGAAVQALADHGLALFAGGVIVTLTPLVVATYFGSLVLKMNPVILCGALAGAQTNAAVLNAVNDAADSNMATLGFTLPFAVNNMILTLAGTLIVAVT